MSETTVEKMYILFDRPDPEGNILGTAHDLDEVAEENKDHRGESGVWYEFDVQGKDLVNPVQRFDLFNWGLPLQKWMMPGGKKKRRKRRNR